MAAARELLASSAPVGGAGQPVIVEATAAILRTSRVVQGRLRGRGASAAFVSKTPAISGSVGGKPSHGDPLLGPHPHPTSQEPRAAGHSVHWVHRHGSRRTEHQQLSGACTGSHGERCRARRRQQSSWRRLLGPPRCPTSREREAALRDGRGRLRPGVNAHWWWERLVHGGSPVRLVDSSVRSNRSTHGPPPRPEFALDSLGQLRAVAMRFWPSYLPNPEERLRESRGIGNGQTRRPTAPFTSLRCTAGSPAPRRRKPQTRTVRLEVW